MTRPRRICLVVDNPLRDLEGIVLVAWQLAKRGAETFLVPMYDQGTAVLGLEPDAVVANYARSTNRPLLRAYSEAGIFVSVLDTEGGIVDSLEDYASSIKRNGTTPFVDQMLTWGPLQQQAFIAHSGLAAEQVVLVGCPRMDFCASPWRDLLPTPTDVAMPFVLVNTNFSLVNPRFSSSLGEELRTTVQAGFSGWDAAYVDRLAAETQQGMERVIAGTAALAKAMPQLNFVVRPHPFENPTTYEKAFAGIPNLQVRLEGAVMSWIKASSAVVHLNCGSAVEAALMGRTAINLDWLNTDTLIHNAPFPRDISYLATSIEQLEALLSPAVNGKPVSIPSDRQAEALVAVSQWFHNEDGRAAERAAVAILDSLDRRQKPDRARTRRLAIIGGQVDRPALGVVDTIGKMVFGKAYRWFRNEVASGSVARGTRAAKTFTVDQVNAIAGRLATADGQSVTVEGVSWNDTWIPGQAATTVALKPRAQ